MLETSIKIKNYNDDFVIIKSDDDIEITLLGAAILNTDLPFSEEIVITEHEILIKLNRELTKQDEDAILGLRSISTKKKVNTYRIPVYFHESEDWVEVERTSGLNKQKYIEALFLSKLEISMYGFLPGFAYIKGLSQQLHIPRKSIPSKIVEAGSLAIGNNYLGLYAIASPGGWHVIGKTPLTIIDLADLPSAPWKPGDIIKLESINKKMFHELKKQGMTIENYNK